MNTFPLIAKTMAKIKPEEGAVLLTAVVILLALTIMGFALVLVTKVDLSVSSNLRMAEEALSAGEIGANMCTQVADKEGRAMEFGETKLLSSSTVEATAGYPQWSCAAIKEGLAPSRGESSLEKQETQIAYYQFRIQSTGVGRGNSKRTVETIIRVRSVVQGGGAGYHRIAYTY